MRTAIPGALALVVAVGLAIGQRRRAVQPSANVAPVKVLEVGHGKVPGKPAVITAVALAAGGKVLASGGDDHLVRIWNTQTGELTQTLKAHADWVRSLSFNPDHTLLLSAGDDHLLVVVEAGRSQPSSSAGRARRRSIRPSSPTRGHDRGGRLRRRGDDLRRR